MSFEESECDDGDTIVVVPPPTRKENVTPNNSNDAIERASGDGGGGLPKKNGFKMNEHETGDHNRLVGPTPTVVKGTTGNSPKSSIRSQPINGTNAGKTTITQQHQRSPSQQLLLSKAATTATSVVSSIAATTAATSAAGQQPPVLQRNGTITLESSVPSAASDAMKTLQDVGSLMSPEGITISLSELNHSHKTVEALGVLVQYLVNNLDAFSNPMLKSSQKKLSNELSETKKTLEKTRSACQSLEDQLADRESYFTKRESELQELHRCEINKIQISLSDLQVTSRERIKSLENELTNKDVSLEQKFSAYCKEVNFKFAEQESQLKIAKEREAELLQRISSLSCTEDELREKVHTSEMDYSERLHAAGMRERELNEKMSCLNKQLDEMKKASEQKELTLQDELNKSHDELTIYKRTHSLPEQKQSSTSSSVNMNRSQEEIESLRCVLEIKQNEISDLRKRNHELQNAQDDLQAYYVKNKALESRVEDLDVQLVTKVEEEKELLQKTKELSELLTQETKNKKRLSLRNEELQYRLKQNAEALAIVRKELSKNCSCTSTSTLSQSSLLCKSNGFNNSTDSFETTAAMTVSQPTSPVIKGVVEKSESVSWIFQMDAEPPEVLASRMVRRAGSVRSTTTEKCSPSPLPKRQKCQTNKVQQSASSHSITQQNMLDLSPKSSTPNARLRSKSVSIKITEPPKKIVRSNSSNAAGNSSKHMDIPLSWNEVPLHSSSPHPHNTYLNKCKTKLLSESQDDDDDDDEDEEEDVDEDYVADDDEVFPQSRLRSSTFNCQGELEIFHRDNNPNFKKCRDNRGLITCDTSKLNARRSLSRPQSSSTSSGGVGVGAGASSSSAITPLRCSTTSIKNDTIKNKSHHHHPKKAAGEAMVSGSNSEDESATSSSSDDISTASSNSTNSNILEEEDEQPNTDILMQKIVGLNGVCNNDTPMEVSWSEDGDHSESNV